MGWPPPVPKWGTPPCSDAQGYSPGVPGLPAVSDLPLTPRDSGGMTAPIGLLADPQGCGAGCAESNCRGGMACKGSLRFDNARDHSLRGGACEGLEE
mmetsp:Transcript_22114/g.51634  ORF Transcript_22114/g.51634 Transcript_22114/m.51634 type:complete len:97 (+) Transcript_22114:592-882(+)